MGREYKKRRKNSRKHRKSTVENLHKAPSHASTNQPRNTLGETTNTVALNSPTKVIKKLKKENRDLRKQAEESNKKYWNARRRNLRLEKAAKAQKVDLKQAKADTTRLRGVVNMLGKNLEDLRSTADETTTLLQARVHAFREETWPYSLSTGTNQSTSTSTKGSHLPPYDSVEEMSAARGCKAKTQEAYL